LDIDTLIQRLMALERRPLRAIKDQRQRLDTRSTAWRDVNGRLSSLLARAEALQRASAFNQRTVTVDNPGVAQVTASSGVAEGTHRLEVIQLAQAHAVTSRAFAGDTVALGLAGTPSINGRVLAVSAGDSLQSIAHRVNQLGAGVRASVVRAQEGQHHLLLHANTTGAASAIQMVDGGGVLAGLGLLVTDPGTGALVANTLTAARDAQFRLNNFAMTRPSNQVSDAMAGVNFTLLAPGTTNVSVRQDADTVVGLVRDFVNQFNSTLDFIRQQLDAGGTLRGDSALRALAGRLPGLIFEPVPGTSGLTRAAEVGLSTGAFGTAQAGQLVLNETTLRARLAADPLAVAALFGAVQVNVARAGAGAAATASSQLTGEQFSPANVINGITDSALWGTTGGGWSDGTAGVFPDTLEIQFGQARVIDSVSVHTVNSATMPASTHGVRNWRLEFHDGTAWRQLDAVTGNTAGVHTHRFAPVSATAIRVLVDAANGVNDHARLVEVEAWAQNQGIARRVGRACHGVTSAAGGISSQRQQSIDQERARLDRQIDEWGRRLERREALLRQQFIAMERALGLMQSQSMWLDQQLNQLAPPRR
jgi:flagellar hook-associated protein 2